MFSRKIFKGINVRKGLELEVPVSDIFKIDTKKQGNIIAMELYSDESKKVPSDVEKLFDKEREIIYITESEKHNINKNLFAYTREIYIIREDENEYGRKRIEKDKFEEVDFVNTKILSYLDFSKNVMDAHAFSNNYKSEFRNAFIGVGKFKFENYLKSNELLAFSNLHFLDFFIFKDNVLASIDNISMANYFKDIREQKEYLSEPGYKKLMGDVKKHRNMLKQEISDMLKNM